MFLTEQIITPRLICLVLLVLIINFSKLLWFRLNLDSYQCNIVRQNLIRISPAPHLCPKICCFLLLPQFVPQIIIFLILITFCLGGVVNRKNRLRPDLHAGPSQVFNIFGGILEGRIVNTLNNIRPNISFAYLSFTLTVFNLFNATETLSQIYFVPWEEQVIILLIGVPVLKLIDFCMCDKRYSVLMPTLLQILIFID